MAAGDGLISMKPTSIVHAGTSASINADGGVDFTAVTSLSLNGVFTGDYDNYLVVIAPHEATSVTPIAAVYRASGSDATGANYTTQRLKADGSTPSGARFTSQTSVRWGEFKGSNTSGDQVHVYGPYLAQPTASRSVSVHETSGAQINDHAGTHSLSTSYDGFTISAASGNFTGTVHVFGYEE